MKKRLFPFLISLSALAVAGSSAFYSVFGLSKLFAGAATQVIIMAGSLEFAKLVSASLLYQYWDTLNKALKGYLMIAVFTLMLITSGGIYGFLSGAYQSTATKSELLDKSLSILNQKQVRFEETKEDLTLEKTQINKSISDLRISLSNPSSVSYWDENSQTVITTTSSSTRRALQKELEKTIIDRTDINIKLEAVLDSLGKTDMDLLNKEISNEDQRELGPLKYLSSVTGWSMDKVVNWFLLLIIFVFDPLAIALVVAANFAFAQIRKPEDKEEDYFVARNKYIEEITVGGGMVEDNTTEPSESLKQRVKENQEKLKEIDEDYFTELEELEARMNIIGQNGNDGLHYGKEKDKNIITSTENLSDDELNDLSKEIGKTETQETIEHISPTQKDLEKLAKALNITYNDEDIPFDRLTDTTQTAIINITNEEDNGKTLRYKGRG
tara:strand:+ start:841 stop:2163 length:1323 start_codon:yes stop_codon:yes gene_type:complete